MPDYKRLNSEQVPGMEQVYRGGPLLTPPKEGVQQGAQVKPDEATALENKNLKKEISVLKTAIEASNAAAVEAEANKEVDTTLSDENNMLKKELSGIKGKAEQIVVGLKEQAEKAEAKSAELEKKLLEAEAATPVSTPDMVFVSGVNKVRPVDDDFTKVYCKLSLERDGEEVDGILVMPNAASKYLKRIGS